jgi:hypothetical protein
MKDVEDSPGVLVQHQPQPQHDRTRAQRDLPIEVLAGQRGEQVLQPVLRPEHDQHAAQTLQVGARFLRHGAFSFGRYSEQTTQRAPGVHGLRPRVADLQRRVVRTVHLLGKVILELCRSKGRALPRIEHPPRVTHALAGETPAQALHLLHRAFERRVPGPPARHVHAVAERLGVLFHPSADLVDERRPRSCRCWFLHFLACARHT